MLVVCHHFCSAFLPGLKAPLAEGGVRETPLFIFVNGEGAVPFFLVLSAFVLTRKLYQGFCLEYLLSALLKRLPRLFLPVSITVMIGAAIFIFAPGLHQNAAKLTGSSWLADFGGGRAAIGPEPGFLSAASDTLMVFFSQNNAGYNTNLWTMMYEFYGSFVAIGLATLCVLSFSSRRYLIIALHVGLALLLMKLHFYMFIPFVAGSCIAFVESRFDILQTPPVWLPAVLAAGAIYGFARQDWPSIVAASALVLTLLICSPSLDRLLSGRVGIFMGRLSFPLYLVHLLVLVSATSALYVSLSQTGMSRYAVIAICFAATWILSLIAAVPFIMLDKIWVPVVNRRARSAAQRLIATGGAMRGHFVRIAAERSSVVRVGRSFADAHGPGLAGAAAPVMLGCTEPPFTAIQPK